MSRATIPIGGDFDLFVTGWSRRDTGAYLNSATVTYALYASDMTTAVSGGTGTLAYVAASDGNYLGRVESTVTATLTPGAIYWAKVVATNGTYDDTRWLDFWADRRGRT